MNEEKHYYIELHANGKKRTEGYTGRDLVRAHFNTDAKPANAAVALVNLVDARLYFLTHLEHRKFETFEEVGARAKQETNK